MVTHHLNQVTVDDVFSSLCMDWSKQAKYQRKGLKNTFSRHFLHNPINNDGKYNHMPITMSHMQ